MSTTAASTERLHIANGHATTSLIAQAMIPGLLSVWADVLHEGPVPGDVSDEQLLHIRARHLAAETHDADAVVTDLREWQHALDTVPTYGEVVLWYEHDLFDQLNLIQLLDRLPRMRLDRTVVSLISIGSFPGRPAFKGMGELLPGDLASLFDTRQPIRGEQYATARRAWGAFRDQDPRAIQALLSTDLSALPFLAAALRRHLEEFPSVFNGLSRSEHHLLTLVAAGESDIWTLFPRMHDGEDCFYAGDLSFSNMFCDLAAASPPLLDVHVTLREPGMLPRGALTLTAAGRDVLGGKADRVRLCGIDRWLGGTHLTPAHLWRWNGATGEIAAG